MSKLAIQKNVLLAPYSTYKIGGKARYFAELCSFEDVKEALNFCKANQCPYYILGKGSNTLFDDRGFNGAVFLNSLESFKADGNRLTIGSGYSFPKLARQSAKLGLSGLEFAIGIPGTLGGALFMNAGAMGQEIESVVEEVHVFDEKEGAKTLKREDISFEYRRSSFQSRSAVILSATLHLIPSSDAHKRQKEYLSKRQRTQPLKEPSCGCVFRNPEEISAGALIEELGLKGYSIGGASVSEVHANFIVNKEGAKACDVLKLTELIENKAYEARGIKLQRELRYIPYREDHV